MVRLFSRWFAPAGPVAYEEQMNFINTKLPKKISSFLLRPQRNKIVPFEYLLRYSSANSYEEKSVLVDPKIARRISDKVLQHSKKGLKTELYDGEGGFGFIAGNLVQHFEKTILIEKDLQLKVFHQLIKSKNLKGKKVEIHPHKISFSQIAVSGHELGVHSPNPFISQIKTESSWDQPDPPYTLVTTCTLGFVKYLTMSLLHRNNPPGSRSFFTDSRPELFLLCTARTLFHMYSGNPGLSPVSGNTYRLRKMNESLLSSPYKPLPWLFSKNNCIFRMLFEFKLIDRIPRQGFLPWKYKHQEFRVPGEVTSTRKLFENFEDELFLVYVRPRLDPGVDLTEPAHLEYFLEVLMRRPKNVAVLPTLEGWIHGLGNELRILNHSEDVSANVLSTADLIHLYNALVKHPDLPSSTFKAGLETKLEYSTNKQGTRLTFH